MTKPQDALARRDAGGLDLSTYDPAKCNILTPSLRFDSAAPFLRYRAVEIRLNPDHEKGDCYAAPGSHWIEIAGRRVPAKLAPAKPGLLKIAAASGLIIDPLHGGRIQPDTCDRCIALAGAHRQAIRCGDCPAQFNTAYFHIGAIRTDTGWSMLRASYEWNLDAQKRKIRREGRKKQEAYEAALAKVASGEWKRAPEPFDFEVYVRDRTDQVIEERYGLAETKALLRLIRAICFVRQVYDRQEIALPFVVVRTELAPDFNDPEVRRALATQATQSASQLFAGIGRPSDDRPIDAVFREHLEQAPDFTKALERAEEVEVPVDTNGEMLEPGDQNGAAAESGLDEMFPEDAGSMGEPAAPEAKSAGPSGPVACVVCDRMLEPARRLWCESEAGQKAVGGRLICFRCQEAETKGAQE